MDTSPELPGVFVAVEGMDGSGKSTWSKYLAEVLRELSLDVVSTFEVGGTPLGMELRKMSFDSKRFQEKIHPVSRLFMIYAARLQHLQEVVLPACQAGKIVITDRFWQSTRVYQGIIDGQTEVMDRIEAAFPVIAQAPDVLIYLRIDPALAFARGQARQNVDNDTYKNDVIRTARVAQAYEKVVNDHISKRDTYVAVIDAGEDEEGVRAQIRQAAAIILERRLFLARQKTAEQKAA